MLADVLVHVVDDERGRDRGDLAGDSLVDPDALRDDLGDVAADHAHPAVFERADDAVASQEARDGSGQEFRECVSAEDVEEPERWLGMAVRLLVRRGSGSPLPVPNRTRVARALAWPALPRRL